MTRTLVPSSNDLWFLPLGGSNEIGMNLNLYGHDNQWLMVDLGVTFGDRHGVEIITPDPSFISERKENLIGLILTHAHEDHIGAIPYLWPYLKCPLYATPFTASLIRQKIESYAWKNDCIIHEIPLGGSVKIGSFDVEFVTLTHSIPEPNALAIRTKLGTIFHTGDWKFDPDPLVGEDYDKKRLKEIGDQKVLAMVCDSTGVFQEGHSGSEKDVRKELITLIEKYPEERIVVACFASNVARLESIAKAAQATGRKAALVGRSLVRMVKNAQENGYLKNLPPFVDERDIMDYPREQILLLCTGSQGEGRAALPRISSKQHPNVRLSEKDVIIFSSRIIPGNEKSIAALHNQLVLNGNQVITAQDEDIHVSGHPARAELRKMYEWLRPQVLVPVHGEPRHLDEHARLGKTCGVPETVVPHNGSLISLSQRPARVIDSIPTKRWAYDGNRMIQAWGPVIQQRNKLGSEGIAVVTVIINKHNELLKPITLTLTGLSEDQKEISMLAKEIDRMIKRTLIDHHSNDSGLLEELRTHVKRAIKSKLSKKPVAEVHLIKM